MMGAGFQTAAALRRPSQSLFAQSVRVAFDYPVHFTRNLFSKENPLLAEVMDRLGENRRHRAAVFMDEGVSRCHPGLAGDVIAYFKAHADTLELGEFPFSVPGGEAAKAGWRHVHRVIDAVTRLRLDRQSYVIAVGGGAVLDMVGFAAAIIHRGLRLIRVPTTTLAQNDAGIGVKNGINDQGQKNFIGTFAPPFAVLNDSRFLETLDFDQWIGGVAEAFKVAIIKDADFFRFLRKRAVALRHRDEDAMAEAIYRCAVLHLDHIRSSGDPFEFGSARPLDFGHWAAHKLESLSAYRIGHGQAVSIGICVDAYVAFKEGLLRREELDHILAGFIDAGLPVWDPLLEQRDPSGRLEILDGIDQFREHLGGRLTITLPDGIGSKIEVHRIDGDLVEAAIAFLARYHLERGEPN